MEIILLFCSSGVAGLFTYIYLDYLSIFDTESPEIKKMFSIMFSLINIGIFLSVLELKKYINLHYVIENIICLLLVLTIIWLTNRFVFPNLIKLFRKSMNNARKSKGLNTLSSKNALDTILQNYTKFYIEKYSNENNNPILQGILEKYEPTIDTDAIFIIEPTPVIKNKEKIIKEHLYQPKNTDNYYKIYVIND
ncbi:TPA: hypothetical protein RQC88_001964 [Staphylococcus aureus]|nr:hypothetical protein [Staphylococcus aureus]